MNSITILLGCSHNPKISKKTGILNGSPCEILVCSECQNDSDLEQFVVEKL